MDLGSNIIHNCDAALVVNGVEVFRLRERSGDGQLVADFDVRDEQGDLIAKVAKNNVVYGRPGMRVNHGPKFTEVLDPTTGTTYARAEEVSTNTIRITGTFTIDGYTIVATQAALKIGGITMSGNIIQGSRRAIVLQQGNFSIGA